MSLTAIAVFSVYLLGLLLAFISHPIYAFFSYLFIFHNHPPAFWWGADLPALRYSLFAAVVALVAVLRMQVSQPTSWYGTAGAKFVIAYAIWMWCQFPWAVNIEAHLEGTILCTKYVVLFFVVYKIAIDEKIIEAMLWALVAGCFEFGWIGYNMVVNGRLETVGGPGIDDANMLAAHLATGAAIAGFMFLGLSGRRRWIAFFSIPFILNGIILTQSRGGLLALLAAAPVALYLSPKPHRRAVMAAIVLGAVLFLTLSNEEFWQRASTIVDSGSKPTEETRIHIVGPQFNMFLDYPMGAGHRGNEFLSPLYIPVKFLSNSGRRSAHNTFMAVLIDQGLPGALLFVGIYVWVWASLVRLKRMDAQGLPPKLGMFRAALGTALVTCFVSGLFLNTLKLETQVWLFALLASLLVLSKGAVKARGQPDLGKITC